MCLLHILGCRYIFHVYDCWTVYVEAVSEETPRYQRKCLHRLCLPGRGHLLFRVGSGTYTHRVTFSTCKTRHGHLLMLLMACLQVFGKGNMVFWIVFSVIHILATLLLSTQLYYMGRWRLGEIST